MIVEEDIEKIKELCREKEEENWGFRSFLKTCEISGKKIDQIVQKYNKAVSDKIDCRKCANCCREMQPVLKTEDIDRLSRALGMSPAEFEEKYLVENEEEKGYTFNRRPCPFLKGNNCTVYKNRPEDCRSYPHLQKSEFTCRTISTIHNCAICPIVFNVYELLKKEIWAMGGDDVIEDIDEDFLEDLDNLDDY